MVAVVYYGMLLVAIFMILGYETRAHSGLRAVRVDEGVLYLLYDTVYYYTNGTLRDTKTYMYTVSAFMTCLGLGSLLVAEVPISETINLEKRNVPQQCDSTSRVKASVKVKIK